MTRKTHLFSALSLLSFALILGSCGDSHETEKKEELKDTTAVVVNTPSPMEDEDSYTLPSPMQIATIFKKSGLKYLPGVTNPADNVNKYKAGSLSVKAINLGVYSADLSFCILNKQTEASKTYFKANRDLAAELGLAKSFETNNLAQRMEQNMAKDDSVIKYLGEIQMQTDNILEENSQIHVGAISFAGAWIECMYIGISVQEKGKNAAVAKELVEQMTIGDNIIKALKAHASKDDGINALVDQLNSLNDIYKNFKSIKEIMATDPDVIDPSKVSVTDEELSKFSKKVIEIRTAFVKG